MKRKGSTGSLFQGVASIAYHAVYDKQIAIPMWIMQNRKSLWLGHGEQSRNVRRLFFSRGSDMACANTV